MTQDSKTTRQHAVLAAMWQIQHQHLPEGRQGAVPVENANQTMQLYVPTAFKQPQMQCLVLKDMACRVCLLCTLLQQWAMRRLQAC